MFSSFLKHGMHSLGLSQHGVSRTQNSELPLHVYCIVSIINCQVREKEVCVVYISSYLQEALSIGQ